MFNNYIAKKRQVQLHKRLEESKKEIQWSSKYHQQIQPSLLAKYQQRINSFVYQMSQNPIIVEDAQRKRANYAQNCGKFIYKNSEDWKSIYTISERLNLAKNKKSNKLKKLNATIDVVPQRNSCFIQFKPIKTQFRHRDKLKQINHPMKFTKGPKDGLNEPNRKRNFSLQTIKEKKEQLQMIIDNESVSKQKTIRESDNLSQIFDFRGRVVDQHEKEEEDDEKQKQIVQKKIHYKKLMTLYLVGDDLQKKEIKQILDKSGYIRKKGRFYTQSTQIDQLESILQKR